jgi:hypothetical protein
MAAAELLKFLRINFFRKSDPYVPLPAEGQEEVIPADDKNVLIIEKRKLSDALGVTQTLRNLNAIIKGLGGENADASRLVKARRDAIAKKFAQVFEQFVNMKRDLVLNNATIAEAHEAALKLAEAAMEAHMKLINRMYPERTEDIHTARTLAKRKADIY